MRTFPAYEPAGSLPLSQVRATRPPSCRARRGDRDVESPTGPGPCPDHPTRTVVGRRTQGFLDFLQASVKRHRQAEEAVAQGTQEAEEGRTAGTRTALAFRLPARGGRSFRAPHTRPLPGLRRQAGAFAVRAGTAPAGGDHGLSGVRCEVVFGQELPQDDRLILADRDGLENIIAQVFHGLSSQTGQRLNSEGVELGR
jgi:hypothetical protein